MRQKRPQRRGDAEVGGPCLRVSASLRGNLHRPISPSGRCHWNPSRKALTSMREKIPPRRGDAEVGGPCLRVSASQRENLHPADVAQRVDADAECTENQRFEIHCGWQDKGRFHPGSVHFKSADSIEYQNGAEPHPPAEARVARTGHSKTAYAGIRVRPHALLWGFLGSTKHHPWVRHDTIHRQNGCRDRLNGFQGPVHATNAVRKVGRDRLDRVGAARNARLSPPNGLQAGPNRVEDRLNALWDGMRARWDTPNLPRAGPEWGASGSESIARPSESTWRSAECRRGDDEAADSGDRLGERSHAGARRARRSPLKRRIFLSASPRLRVPIPVLMTGPFILSFLTSKRPSLA